MQMPMVRVWALWCVDAEAQGMKPAGPRYGERDHVEALNAAIANGTLNPRKLINQLLPGRAPVRARHAAPRHHAR
jgi:hypothetical protein